MIHFRHCSDTIAIHDTTVTRLDTQYACLSAYLGVNHYETHYVASEFGNSEMTAHTVLETISSEAFRKNPGVICVNNASRSKHTNSGNAKGSVCRRASLHYDRNDVEVVGVDDQVRGYLLPWVVEGTMKIVHDITLGDITVYDISQGSQFRSLEYFPVVQVLIAVGMSDALRFQHDPAGVKKLTFSSDGYTYSVPVLNHLGDSLLRTVQCIGQFRKFCHDRNCSLEKVYTHEELQAVQKYHAIRKTLAPNQLMILDRDHYGNTKAISSHDDGITGLLHTLSKKSGDQVNVSRARGSVEGYLVQSISDMTGYPCLWNGSSRGPDDEIFIELNFSIDETGRRREEIITLPLGTLLTIQ